MNATSSHSNRNQRPLPLPSIPLHGAPVLLAVIVLVLAGCQQESPVALDGGGYPATRIANDEYPRAFFFRSSEGMARNPETTYEEWEQTFSRLLGIMGKTLDEEVPETQRRNVEFFTRFKQDNPDQVVLLHFNGNARDPRWEAEEFFAGHWIYFRGSKVLSEIPAEAGETDVQVADASLYKTGVGRYRNSNEDIGICMLDADGKPNWRESEQVQLVSVDAAKGVIRVKRGAYGTSPRAFPAGKAYAAAHAHEGPWGEKSNLMWLYNYAAECPKDANGRNCADIMVDDVANRFQPGGHLAAYDGLEFDVLKFRPGPDVGARGLDLNADGEPDQGVFDGFNSYGAGVTEFCRRLREQFPRNKIIMADGMGLGNQRAFHILNGIESEGFPHLRDFAMRDWSGGLNRHMYWAEHAKPPVFNYINHKFNAPDPVTGLPYRPDLPFGVHRLVFAAAVFTDAAVCYSTTPDPEPGEHIGIWDELQMGTEKKLGWLGKAAGPAVKLAEKQPDLLGGQGSPMSGELVKRFSGDGVEVALDGQSVKITGKDNKAAGMKWRLAGVPAKGPDLYVTMKIRGAQWTGYPPETPRLMRVNASGSKLGPFMAFAGSEDFTAGFYFADASGATVDLEFDIEGPEAVWISDIRVFAHPDAMCREFENGLVLANPSPRPYTFNLAELAPGKSFRRLQGSPAQDPATNNGADVGGTLELAAKDGIFLVAK